MNTAFQIPGPGSYSPSLSLTKPSIQAATFPKGTPWRTEPLPLWKKEVNNVGFPLLDSVLSKRAAVVCGKHRNVPTPRSHNPPMNKYNVPRWPSVPFKRSSQGDKIIAPKRFREEEAAKALAKSLYEPDGQWEWDMDDIYAFRKEHEGQPLDRGDGRNFTNPGPAAYTPNDSQIRAYSSKGRAFSNGNHWRTAPIPLWKQEVNNVPFVMPKGSIEGSVGAKIVPKPRDPPTPRSEFPAPDHYNIPRFPNSSPYEETEGKLKHLGSSAARAIRMKNNNGDHASAIRNHALPASKGKTRKTDADAAQLRPVELPDGIKRAYSFQLRRWYWFDPATSELCLAPQDETQWLAKRRANLYHPAKYLYAEEGGKLVDGGMKSKPSKMLKAGLHDSRRRGHSKFRQKSSSSPFLSLETHRRTKSGMKVPKQCSTSLPVSSIQSHKKDILSWIKYAQGPHAIAKDAPILHGMMVRSVKPPQVSQSEMSRILPRKISGMTNRLNPNLHPSWEDSRERWRPNLTSKGGKHDNSPIHEQKEEPPLWKADKSSLALSRVESDEVTKGGTESQVNVQETSPSVLPQPQKGDRVLYRLPNGTWRAVCVVQASNLNDDGWVVQTRPNAPLIRRARFVDIAPWFEDINQRPKCVCGKHAAHSGMCFEFGKHTNTLK